MTIKWAKWLKFHLNCESPQLGAPAGVRLTWQGGTCWRESARGEGAPAGVNIPGLPVISNPAWDQR